MLVAEGHEVRGYDVVVGGFEAGGGEGPGNELTGGWVGGMRGLMGVQGAAVILGWSELVSKEVIVRGWWFARVQEGGSYLLRGSWYFLSFAFDTGS